MFSCKRAHPLIEAVARWDVGGSFVDHRRWSHWRPAVHMWQAKKPSLWTVFPDRGKRHSVVTAIGLNFPYCATHGFLDSIFTARCYASAVLAMALCLSVCPSVCLSVTSRCSTKTAKRRITQTTPHDSTGTLVSWRQRSPRNSTGVTSYEDTECRWGGSKSATFDQ